MKTVRDFKVMVMRDHTQHTSANFEDVSPQHKKLWMGLTRKAWGSVWEELSVGPNGYERWKELQKSSDLSDPETTTFLTDEEWEKFEFEYQSLIGKRELVEV